jgi:hypothetical protein
MTHSETLEERGHFLMFDHEPSVNEVEIAAGVHALGVNLDTATRGTSVLSRYDFRARFTLEERMAIDNFEASALPAEYKAILRTVLKDFDSTQEIDCRHPATLEGVGFLETVGLLAAGRAAQVLGT